MTKVIDSLVQASIDSKNYAGVLLCRAHFSSILRLNNTHQSIYWDESGGGEVEYVGAGNLATVNIIPETNELVAQQVQFILSGIPNTLITDAFSDEYSGEPIYLWYGTLNKETYAVEGDEDGPVLIFAGLMDNCNIEFGETATITLNATSRLADWERPHGGRYNNSYQIRYVDATDDGFKFMKPLQNKSISWGRYTLLDPITSGGSKWW
jgi:hypothetical protein